MEDTNEKFGKGLRVTTLVTFLIGACLFTGCYFIRGKFLLAGLGFIVLAFIINVAMASIGISEGSKSRDRKLLWSGILMLINVVVMCGVAWFVFG
jgi:hypothetical protein